MKVDAPARTNDSELLEPGRSGRTASEELIIKEARRRHRRRLLTISGIAVVGVAASLVAAVSLTGHGQSPRKSYKRPPIYRQPASPPEPTIAAACVPSNLSVSVFNTGPGAGSWDLAVAFRNTGASTCTLVGYPQLQMIGTSGQPIPTTSTDATPGELAPPVRPYRVTNGAQPVALRPGKEASFTIGAGDGNGAYTPLPNCPATASFQISLPGARPGSSPILATVPPFTGNPQHPWIAYPTSDAESCGAILVSVIAAGGPG